MSAPNQYVEFIGLDPHTRLVQPIAGSYTDAGNVRTSIEDILQYEELLPARTGLDIVGIKSIDEWTCFSKFNISSDYEDNYFGLTYRSPFLNATSLKRLVDIIFKNLRIENCVALIRRSAPLVLVPNLVSEFDPKCVTLIDEDRLLIRSSSFATVNLEITKIII